MSFLKNIQNSTTSVVIPVLAAPTSQIATIVTQHYGSSIKVRGALMALGIGCGVVSIALVPISVAVMLSLIHI